MPTLAHATARKNLKTVPAPAPVAEAHVDDALKGLCCHCGVPVPPERHGWAAECVACEAELSGSSDPSTWPDWTDLPALSLLDPADDRLTLLAALGAIQRQFLDIDSDIGDLVAESIGDLMTEARITQAATADQLRDRRAVLSL